MQAARGMITARLAVKTERLISTAAVDMIMSIAMPTMTAVGTTMITNTIMPTITSTPAIMTMDTRTKKAAAVTITTITTMRIRRIHMTETAVGTITVTGILTLTNRMVMASSKKAAGQGV